MAATHPEQIGKPLQDELQGLYRLTFGRYRVIYGVDRTGAAGKSLARITVHVVLVGLRKAGDKRDVYRVAQRLARRGEL